MNRRIPIALLVLASGLLTACETESSTRTGSEWWRNTNREPSPSAIPSSTNPAPTYADDASSRTVIRDSSLPTARDAGRGDAAARRDTSTAAQGTSVAGKDMASVTIDSPEARILSILHAKNVEEIRMGKLAQQNGSSEGVQAFGAELVREHTECDAKVMIAARNLNITLWNEQRVNGKEGMGPRTNHQDLANLQGSDFDRAFASKMLAGHRELIQTVESAQATIKNERVRDLLATTLPKLREHERTAASLAGSEMPVPKSGSTPRSTPTPTSTPKSNQPDW